MLFAGETKSDALERFITLDLELKFTSEIMEFKGIFVVCLILFYRCQLSRTVCAKKCSTQQDIIRRFCHHFCARGTRTARRTPVR